MYNLKDMIDIRAASEAVAATTMEYFIESFSSSVLTNWATVDLF